MIWIGGMYGCASGHKKYVIGVSQCSEDIWRDKLNDELMMGEYLNDSIIVKLASSNDDNVLQNKQVNQFVDEGVDLLIISPNQLSAISKAVERAYDKGIPVILYDRKANTQKYTAFIGCDNYAIGKAMGKFIVQQLHGKGRIAEIRGLEGSSPALERHRGFMDAIKNYPSIKIVASEAGDWKEESAILAMKRILGKTQNFDYVFSHNDRMAWGAYVAARQMGVKHSYKYTGVDAMATEGGGLELVRDGMLKATYLYPTKGDEVISLAMKILKKQPYKRDNYLSTSIITKDNAELTLMEAKDAERQAKNLTLLHRQVDQYLSDYNSQKLLLIGLFVFLLVCIIAAVSIFRGYVVKTRLNEQLAKKNDEQKQLNEEQKRLNGELASKNDELKRLNEEVMELTHSRLVFFTNISHELRTPLTLIADPVEMLLEDKGIKGKSRDLLKMVQRNAKALQQLVGSILDFRKIQNGKMDLKLSCFDIVKALQMWTGDFALTAKRKQIQLHLDTAQYVGDPEIIADEEKIARVVFNLLSNAMKYTPAGGEIFVSLRAVDDAKAETASSESEKASNLGGMLRIDVRDTGKGIAKDEVPKVFERFFQAKGAASGTGIGLALVKSFVELHHGEAQVESDLGKGADFYFVIPRKQEGEVADHNVEVIHSNDNNVDNSVSPSSVVSNDFVDASVLPYIDDSNKNGGKLQQVVEEQTNKPTLLIIDDNSDIRQYERTILQDDYIVLEASDGKEGLEVAKRAVPDLVICDVMMPVMDGLEFTEQLKTNMATSHIPVIMLTAKNLEEQRAEGYEHGSDSYITKPFSSKVLLARIENLLKQRKLLKSHFQHLLQDVSSPQKTSQEVVESHLEPRDKQFIKQLHDIIQKNLSDTDFGVEDIGKEIGLSRVQLYRKVKAMTGSSVVDLIRKSRLAKSRRLLESRSMSISEVAYDVGFSSPSYFTKCFKDEYGMLPGEVGA